MEPGTELYSEGISPRINRVVIAEETGTGGAVPEPTSWSLMIGGFGLDGLAVRHCRWMTV